jgi:hypothetical protein
MRGGDDIREPRELRRRHLIRRAANIHRRARDAALAQCVGQGLLIDQIAARQIDEKGVRLHPRQSRLPDQIFGLLIGDREAHHIVRAAEQIVERHMFDIGVVDGHEGIGDRDLHAQRLGDERQRPADAAIADDAKTAAGELAPHHDLGLAARMIVRGRARYAARQIDHEAERKLRHRRDEAGRRPRHQHAGCRCGIDVDIADIDRAANEGAQL